MIPFKKTKQNKNTGRSLNTSYACVKTSTPPDADHAAASAHAPRVTRRKDVRVRRPCVEAPSQLVFTARSPPSAALCHRAAMSQSGGRSLMSVANAKHTVLNPVRSSGSFLPVLLTPPPWTQPSHCTAAACSSLACASHFSHSVQQLLLIRLLITVPAGGAVHWAHTRRPAPRGDRHHPGHCASRRWQVRPVSLLVCCPGKLSAKLKEPKLARFR